MNEVNKTLFIPLYGKSLISKQHIILNDPDAERIWDAEGFPIRGKSKSKWLAYNMAMRARVFDNWTGRMLKKHRDALGLFLLEGPNIVSEALRLKKGVKRVFVRAGSDHHCLLLVLVKESTPLHCIIRPHPGLCLRSVRLLLCFIHRLYICRFLCRLCLRVRCGQCFFLRSLCLLRNLCFLRLRVLSRGLCGACAQTDCQHCHNGNNSRDVSVFCHNYLHVEVLCAETREPHCAGIFYTLLT